MYKRILVPVDGSSASTRGLQEAVRFAKDQQARLRIIHVVDEAVLAQYPEMMDASGDMLTKFVDDGRKTLQKALALAERQGIKADTVMYRKLMGALADFIVREAEKWRADIIVIGTAGATGMKHFFLAAMRKLSRAPRSCRCYSFTTLPGKRPRKRQDAEHEGRMPLSQLHFHSSKNACRRSCPE
jgi:nucleotide-binding universal stress UspA family protein